MLEINFFNPVVDNWNEEAYQRELLERENCDYCLYVITPKMTGVYAIAEVVDDSNKHPDKTIFAYLGCDPSPDEDEWELFSDSQMKSLRNVARMVEANGGVTFTTLQDVAAYLNSTVVKEKYYGMATNRNGSESRSDSIANKGKPQ